MYIPASFSFFLTSPIQIRDDAEIRTKSYRKEIIAGDPWHCEADRDIPNF